MINNWVILPNIIFGYDKNLNISNFKFNKILLFDLDSTIIKTKSGRVFPIDKNDWDLLHDNVLQINGLSENNICGIISNQGGLKNETLINNWIDKIKQINKKINIHFVFASIKDDNFRKPLPASWDYIKNNLLQNTNLSTIISSKKIYYIGDAFGRANDHADTDVKYAINCGFKFKTPEAFFYFDKTKENLSGTITYPEITYYTESEQKKLFDSIFEHINSNEKVIVIMIGFPASGKSYLRKEITKKFNNFKYTNNDDLQDKIIDQNLVKSKELQSYNYCIEDNTNLNIKSRKNILDSFQTHKKIGIWLNLDMDVYKHLNYLRMYWFGNKLINQIIYRTLNKSYSKPEVSEGFDYIIEINKVFNNFNFDNKIKYYF
jgi:bifunctional polynucleotide phosphatase/kinase